MKALIFSVLLAIGLMAGPTAFASNGDNNGKPFQDLQAAVEAALAAEAAARQAADEAEAAARMAADNAESIIRAVADAELSAAIAAEQLARMVADQELLAELDMHESQIQDLDERVSVLEGIPPQARTVTWTETSGFDVLDIKSAVASLNIGPNDWILMTGTRARTGQEWAICSDDPVVRTWLTNAASGNDYSSFYVRVSLFAAESWYHNYTVRVIQAHDLAYPYEYLRVDFPANSYVTYQFMVRNEFGNPEDALREIIVRYSGGWEYWNGNTITINVADNSLDACGF